MFVGTLRSRVALVDDTGVRARMAASWLVQMGWSVGHGSAGSSMCWCVPVIHARPEISGRIADFPPTRVSPAIVPMNVEPMMDVAVN